jgi:membrane-bound serine protease (ClpP class)
MTGWIALLLVGGVALVLAEIILPGLICGIVGSAMIIGGLVLSAQTYPELAVPLLAGEIFGIGVLLVVGFYLISWSGGISGLTLKASQKPEDGYVNVTALRPSGTIEVAGERLDAVSASVYIDRDRPVRVVEVHGNRVVVEPEE